MKGYFKNEEATQAAFTNDGWLKTGDSGVMKGRKLFIKGRIKTMILTANGQNIYPEEIESRLNNLPYVAESLVVERENRLVAIIFPDYPALAADNVASESLNNILNEYKLWVNKSVANYEKISAMEIQETEFEKTPKKSIKRFLYT